MNHGNGRVTLFKVDLMAEIGVLVGVQQKSSFSIGMALTARQSFPAGGGALLNPTQSFPR